ncbi:MAG: Abi family protein [Clostridia bacterium]|nr:Abi family protein [Clostridia bacterium]
MVPSLKPALSYEQQLDLLESRGMVISDREAALSALQSSNYYRISGYAFEFKTPGTENYEPGTEFAVVMALYELDSHLRNILLRYLEEIEISVRTRIAYFFSHEYGPYGHYMPWNFASENDFSEFEISCANAVNKNKNVQFIQHHIRKYSTPTHCNIHLWALVEILSFSTISKFYSAIAPTVQRKIASAFNSDPSYLSNQIHCMANLRNICAHYGRLYNRPLFPAVRLSPSVYRNYHRFFSADVATTYLFGYLLAMKNLLPFPSFNRMFFEIDALLDNYYSIVNLNHLGFPAEWREYLDLCFGIKTGV